MKKKILVILSVLFQCLDGTGSLLRCESYCHAVSAMALVGVNIDVVKSPPLQIDIHFISILYSQQYEL